MDDPLDAAHTQALKLLARREHGRAELARKLAQRGLAEHLIAPALQRLIEAGYLSDARYAQARVTELRRRRYGPLRALAELRAGGVDEQAIAEAVQVDDREWYRVCRAACERSVGCQRPASPAEAARLRQKLIARGFTAAQIRAALATDDSDDA